MDYDCAVVIMFCFLSSSFNLLLNKWALFLERLGKG